MIRESRQQIPRRLRQVKGSLAPASRRREVMALCKSAQAVYHKTNEFEAPPPG
jgi:hypothetical protein